MKDMKLTKAESQETMPTEAKSSDGPKYPYGLELRLEGPTLEKLGMDSLPKVGRKMRVSAVAEVTGVSSNEHNGHKSKCVTLQITKMEVASGARTAEEAVEEGIDDAA